MQYLFKKHGVPCIYAGKNITLEMLGEICAHQYVTQVYFNLITNLIRCDINEYLLKLSKALPGKEIIFSGASTCQVECNLPGVRLLKCTEEMMAFSKKTQSLQ
jgi:hypothetical protein